MTIAQEEADRKHAEQYNESIDNGGIIRKSKRLQSLTKQPRINTSRLRRLHQLFWLDDDSYNNDDDSSSSNDSISTSTTSNVCGDEANDKPLVKRISCPKNNRHSNIKISSRLSLKRIHSSPHIYTVDNFLTESELQYFEHKIKLANDHKLFKKSFTDNGEGDNQNRNPKKKNCKRQKISNNEEKLREDKNQNNVRSIDLNRAEDKSTSIIQSQRQQQQHIIEETKKQRTSRFIHFTKQLDSTITTIEQRACDLLSVPNDNIEPLQLVKYNIGQYFNVHHDLGVLYDDGSVEMPQRRNALLSPPRRIVTILVYLNDVNQCNGGSTRFPMLTAQLGEGITKEDQCDGDDILEIYPKRGMAVMWCNITKDGLPDPRVVHSGEALVVSSSSEEDSKVKEGSSVVKYALNIWACEY